MATPSSTPSGSTPQKFGRYEVVREVHRGVRGSVYAARLAGTTAEPQYVIKTFRLPRRPDRDPGDEFDHASAAVEAEAFVEQSRLQQELSETENSHWAPVYAVATTDAVEHELHSQPSSGPPTAKGQKSKEFYRVGKLFPRSAHDLISGKVRLSPSQLQQLMTGVLRGLIRIHRHANRPHGNVKPFNVLIEMEGAGGRRGNQNLIAALTDPLPSRVLGGRRTEYSEARDLADAGRLLAALVSHRWAGAHDSSELQPEWFAASTFGRHAGAWETLCRRMLEAPALDAAGDGAALTCEAALAELERIAPKARFGGAPLLRIAAPAAATIVVATGLFLWLTHDPEVTECSPIWKRGWAEYDAWFQHIAAHHEGPDPLQGDAHLKTILQEAREVSPFDIASGAGSAADHAQRRPSKRRVQAMEELLVEMDQARESLKQWPVIERLKRHAADFESHAQDRGSGWSRTAAHLNDVIERATPPEAIQEFAGDCESNYDDVVRAHKKEIRAGLVAASDADHVTDSIAKHDAALQQKIALIRAANTQDIVLANFDDMVRQTVDAELSRADRSPAECTKALATKLASLDVLAADVNAIIGRMWNAQAQQPWKEGQIDVDWFHRNNFYASAQSNVTEQLTREWCAQITSKEFARLDPALDPRLPMQDNLKETFNNLKRLAAAPEFPELQQQYEKLQTLLNELEPDAVWSHSTRQTIQDRLAQAQEQERAFREKVQVSIAILEQDAGEYEKGLRQLPRRAISASAALENMWQSECARWLDQRQVDATTLLLNLRPVEQKVKALDAKVGVVALPDANAEWVNRAKQVAWQRREQCLAAVAGELIKTAGSSDVDRIVQQSQAVIEYQQWATQAQEIVASASAIEARLDDFAELHEARDGSPSIAQLNERARSSSAFQQLQEALSPVLNRVARLQDVEREQSLRTLAQAADQDSDRAIQVAAWRQLGRLDGEERWPSSVDDLKFEHRVQRERIEPLGIAAAEMREQAKARWNRCFEQLEAAKDIVQAVALMSDFNVAVDDIASDRSRFNYALVQLKSQVSALESDKLKRKDNQVTQKLLNDFRGNIGSFAGNSEASALLTEIKRIEDEIAKEKPIQFDQIGPGASKDMNWTVTRIDGTDDLIECMWTAPSDRRSQFANTRSDGKPQPSSHKLVFRLFRDDDLELPFYISTTEVPLGLLVNIIDAHNSWKEFNALMSGSISSAAWEGPRVWSKDQSGARLLPNAEWQSDQHWSGMAKYMAQPPPPGFDHPVQHIPAPVAAYVARLVNCRFPASQEWKRAFSNHTKTRDALKYIEDTANVRDAAWLQQWNFVAEQGKELIQGKPRNVASCWPDRGAHWPANRPKPDDAAAPPPDSVYSHDDGFLWFRPIRVDGSFHDLVGNVAEYVFDDVAAIEAAPLNKLDALLRSKSSQLGVIGGSALSDRRIPVDAPQPIEPPRLVFPSYSDVGFRLAFSAPGARVKYLAEQVHDLLNQQKNWFVIAKR